MSQRPGTLSCCVTLRPTSLKQGLSLNLKLGRQPASANNFCVSSPGSPGNRASATIPGLIAIHTHAYVSYRTNEFGVLSWVLSQSQHPETSGPQCVITDSKAGLGFLLSGEEEFSKRRLNSREASSIQPVWLGAAGLQTGQGVWEGRHVD